MSHSHFRPTRPFPTRVPQPHPQPGGYHPPPLHRVQAWKAPPVEVGQRAHTPHRSDNVQMRPWTSHDQSIHRSSYTHSHTPATTPQPATTDRPPYAPAPMFVPHLPPPHIRPSTDESNGGGGRRVSRWGPPTLTVPAAAAASASAYHQPSGYVHPDRRRAVASRSESSSQHTHSDGQHRPPSPLYYTSDEPVEDTRPPSPLFAVDGKLMLPGEVRGGAGPSTGPSTGPTSSSSSSTGALYDASQRAMRDPANRTARDASHRIRDIIKRDKREHLTCAAKRQRTERTFKERGRLHQWDGGCGSGGVAHYAFESGIHILVGCDVSQARVNEARAVYAKLAERVRRSPHTAGARTKVTTDRSMFAAFSCADAFAPETHAYASALGPYDIISYFNTLHYAASSEDVLRRQFAFWEQQLTDTGSVIVQTVDADVLMHRLNEEWIRLHTTFSDEEQRTFCAPVPLRLTNRFYAIEWPARQSVQAMHTGQPYTFTFLASMAPTTEYLMRAEDLLRLAGEHGLVCTRDTNTLQGIKSDATRNALTEDERDVVQLYRTYVFERVCVRSSL